MLLLEDGVEICCSEEGDGTVSDFQGDGESRRDMLDGTVAGAGDVAYVRGEGDGIPGWEEDDGDSGKTNGDGDGPENGASALEGEGPFVEFCSEPA